MKKWLIGGVALILLACQFLIPKQIVVSKTVIASANLNAAFRFLSSDANWAKWWPFKNFKPDTTGGLPYGNYNFRKTETRYNSFAVGIGKNEEAKNSLLNMIQTGSDSLKLVWSVTLHAGSNNPISKIILLFQARDLGKSLQSIMSALGTYISQVKNLYGFDIRLENINLEHTISTRRTLPRYPGTADIYSMMHAIETYIATQPVKIEDLPILNIQPEDSVNYDVLVAIPVDKPVPDSGIFKAKKLLRTGLRLVTEFYGGRYTTQQALKEIEKYADDHRFRNIALPYQIFLNDRTAEKDTSKWQTRLSYPVL